MSLVDSFELALETLLFVGAIMVATQLIRRLFLPRLFMAKGIVASPEGGRSFAAAGALDGLWQGGKMSRNPLLLAHLAIGTTLVYSMLGLIGERSPLPPNLLIPTLFVLGGLVLAIHSRRLLGSQHPKVQELTLRMVLGAGVLLLLTSAAVSVAGGGQGGSLLRNLIVGIMAIAALPIFLIEDPEYIEEPLLADMIRIFPVTLIATLFSIGWDIDSGAKKALCVGIAILLVAAVEILSGLFPRARGTDLLSRFLGLIIVGLLLAATVLFGGIL